MRSDKPIQVDLEIVRMLVLQKMVLRVQTRNLIFPKKLVVIHVQAEEMILLTNFYLIILNQVDQLEVAIESFLIFVDKSSHVIAAVIEV